MTRKTTLEIAVVALILMATACSTPTRSGDTNSQLADFRSTSPIPLFVGNPYEKSPAMVFPASPISYYNNLQKARELSSSNNCIDSEEALLEVLDDYQDDGSIWFDLAVCQAQNGSHQEAIASFKEAISLGSTWYNSNFDGHPSSLEVEIAKQYALLGETNLAVEWIGRALTHRYPNRIFLRTIPEFAPIVESGEFDEVFGIANSENLSREERWRHDISFFADQIQELHIDPDFKTSSEELNADLIYIIDNLGVLSDQEIAAKLLVFMGKLGTGHDFMLFGSALEWMSIKTYFFSDGLYIIEAENENLVGARIDEIAGMPAFDAFKVVQRSVTRDNNMSPYWNGTRMLLSPVVLVELGIADSIDDVALQITSRDGVRSTVRPSLRDSVSTSPALAPNGFAPVPKYLESLSSPIWYEALEDGDLYIQINNIIDSSPGEFFSVSEDIKNYLGSNETSNIVLDLRHCQGGNGTLSVPLIRSLIAFNEESPRNNLLVLIGRNTFSAAQLVVGSLEMFADPVFVGEPTGGRPTFAGTAGQFSLPHSGILFFVPAEYAHTGWVGDQRNWVSPDIPVQLSSEDYFNGTDVVLETALEYLVQ